MKSASMTIDLALQEFGLSDVEALVYRSALELGPRPASVIAEKAGLKRSHTYNVLGTLGAKGIVQELVKNSVRHFAVSPPQTLLSIMDDRESQLAVQKERVKAIVPALEKLQKTTTSKPKVRFYRGLDGIKEIFEDIVRTTSPGDEILGLLDLRYSWSTVGDKENRWAKKYIARREKAGLRSRALTIKSDLAEATIKKRPSALRTTKYIEDLNFPAELHIYAGKVAFQSTHKEMVGVIIENEPITETLTSMFEALWDNLPGEIKEG